MLPFAVNLGREIRATWRNSRRLQPRGSPRLGSSGRDGTPAAPMGLNERATPRRTALLALPVDALFLPQFARAGGRREPRGFLRRFGLFRGHHTARH